MLALRRPLRSTFSEHGHLAGNVGDGGEADNSRRNLKLKYGKQAAGVSLLRVFQFHGVISRLSVVIVYECGCGSVIGVSVTHRTWQRSEYR